MCCEEKEHISVSENKMGICCRFDCQRKPLGSNSKAEVKRIYERLHYMFISQDRLNDAAIIASNS